ncbi:hypothetical protein CEN49_01265 [Fischerella thermalis CCMEE 5273]|uniref:Uncharacterized protein n=1 Tax=Chlorogloeopsis fritschii PCC 6912 TaxID=211165 RepID=A0A3S1FQW5_CHLFR|nr:hypothetical protein [Chlorogloeopsis fritschii]PMB11646.1 hypothetical protein CEN49_01265 [Fischerella thermalis CCMEE 5273]PMB46190.1 hypothetical protein CEN40_10730 [Fischerella thermalis CCMEE 5205]RUR83812.1 hypothetical protein PCC6912_20550 [Chlorogloeopsis fritschii PCC 6912]
MNNQDQNQESITNPKVSYGSDLNSSNNNNAEDDEIDEQVDSNSTLNSKTYLITILIHPDEQQAILSIGIRNAPPIIETINYQEITSQPILRDYIHQLEEALPKIIEAAEKTKVTTKSSNQKKQIQKRELPANSQEVESNKKQLSLF